jgi:predicted HTH transcriptional regulator
MLDVIEDSRNEFKEILNEKLEKEVVSFLTATGGNIYIGVNNNGEIVGIDDDVDKLQLIIKDRIKNNIAPSTLGLFDIDVKTFNDKKYIHITVASGNEKPYYLRKKGMTPDGCFIRVGSSCESLNEKQIEELYSKRTKTSLTNIISPKQSLTFSQLKIYYEEKRYNINDNFLKQLDLIMDDGKYNYLAYLLSDTNNISIKVATYSGNDAYDLIENEEYGYCCLIKAAKNVINKFEQINKTYTKITFEDRKEVKMFDSVAIKEAILNSFVHTLWEREYPPKFEIFNDHIAISSTGGLPLNVSKDDFLKGFSAPTHPELMRVFKDLDLVEQLGTGIIRILKSYDKDVYEFSDNFIRVNFKFNDNSLLPKTPRDLYFNQELLSETQENIIKLIKEDNKITQLEISDKLGINKTTVTRNLKVLKEKKIIRRTGSTKNGQWEIL